jgi:uncharacterized membrane protein (UPF0127 family)
MGTHAGLRSVKNLKNQALVADKCVVAESFFSRLRGLIGRARLEPGEAMFFPRCNNVHMWFMRFAIDVVFLDERMRVLSVRESVRAWKLLPVGDIKAAHALELSAGSVARLNLARGDELCLS